MEVYEKVGYSSSTRRIALGLHLAPTRGAIVTKLPGNLMPTFIPPLFRVKDKPTALDAMFIASPHTLE